MAITIVSTPQELTPCNNPMSFSVTSNNTSQENFSYVFSIFTGTTASTMPVAVMILPPVPGPTAGCEIHPNVTLQKYISYDLKHNITAPAFNVNSCLQYNILYGEEYGALSTGVTRFSALTFSSGYTFNGVLQYEDVPGYKFTDFILTAATVVGDPSRSRFLTNSPPTIKIKNDTDRGFLTFINDVVNTNTKTARYFKLVVTNTTGTTTSILKNTTWSGFTNIANAYVSHIPSGVWNLNNYSGIISTGVTPFITAIASQYYIVALNDTFAEISERKTFVIDDQCYPWASTRLMWLNKLGGMDTYSFNLKSIHRRTDIKRNNFEKVIPTNYNLGDRGLTTISSRSSEDFDVSTGWLTDDESVWISEDLFDSPEVYELRADGSILPVIITSTETEIQRSFNKPLLGYTLSLKYAFDRIAQTN